MGKFDSVTEAWLAELRAAGASEGTIELRTWHLRRWARVCASQRLDPLAVTHEDLVQFLATAGATWRPQYRRTWRATFRTFYAWAYQRGHVETDPASQLRPVRCPPAEPVPADDRVIRATIARAGRRELLLILLMAEAGLRRGEAAKVRDDDLISSGGLLRVRGKGGRERLVPLTEHLWTALAHEGPGYVFPNGFGGPLSSPHVGKLLRRLLPAGTTPHSLRRAAATALVEEGAPLSDVQQFLGHSYLNTTQLYIGVNRDRLARLARKAARRFDAA